LVGSEDGDFVCAAQRSHSIRLLVFITGFEQDRTDLVG
jgi:hypothetical protein